MTTKTYHGVIEHCDSYANPITIEAESRDDVIRQAKALCAAGYRNGTLVSVEMSPVDYIKYTNMHGEAVDISPCLADGGLRQ